MIECTYLEENKRSEAEARPRALAGAPVREAQREMAGQTTWVLIHFSLRYPDEEVCAFFRDTERSGVILEEGEGGEDRTRPPDLVLWLDTGVVQLWVRSFTAAAESRRGGQQWPRQWQWPSCAPCDRGACMTNKAVQQYEYRLYFELCFEAQTNEIHCSL